MVNMPLARDYSILYMGAVPHNILTQQVYSLLMCELEWEFDFFSLLTLGIPRKMVIDEKSSSIFANVSPYQQGKNL